MLSIKGELIHLDNMRKVLDYLYDGNQDAFSIMYYIKNNFKEWESMLLWLKTNDLRGQKLVDFFKHESPDNGGYIHGCMLILSRIKGNKNGVEAVKINELN